MAKEKKPPKAKIHKMFKIKYSPTHWERFLEKCYHESDREKLLSFFEQDKKKRYVLRKDLTAEETQELSEIGKRIELGYSFLQVWKLVAVGVIFLGVSAFLALFQNKLLENAIEKSLEAVFDAKVDVVGVRLNIPGLSFSFRSLTVGDAENPYRNLFELGKTELKLNPDALTLGRVVFENVQCEDIRWGTSRTTPGTLSRVSRGEKSMASSEEKAPANKVPTMDFSQVKENFSSLISSQRTNLKSEQTLLRVNTELSNTIEQWMKTYEQKNAQLAQLSTQAAEIQKIQVASLKTVEEAQKAFSQIDAFSKSLSSIGGDIKTTGQQFKTTYEKALQSQKTIATAIAEDKAYLQSLISLPVTDGKNILQGMADKFLRQKLGAIYTYGMRAWRYAEKIKSDPSQKPKKQGYRRLNGRDIPYPSDPYPSFLLKNLQSSVENTDRRFEARLQNVSSDPYKWDKPIQLTYRQLEKLQNYALNVSLDIRSNAVTPLVAEFKGEGLPFSVSDLGFLKISNLSASMKIVSSFQWDRDKSTGKISVILSGLRWEKVDLADFVTKVVTEILAETPSIDVVVTYTILSDGNLQFTLASSLDTVLQKKIGEYLAKTAKELEEIVEKQLNVLLQQGLSQNELLAKNLQNINQLSLKSLSDVTSYEKLVETKKKEVENRIEQIKKEQEEALKKKAQEAVQQLPLPKIGK
ncbi:TIGR03545 family protein [Thermospira aquatica]|uniref:TIGR03545 family protein n=1 Tax=Thermospira aquatica TaxID=2828656 RepID=A0AAX3BG44_9SPIR|nr:TIGR03545 family protein [Thermospira aquatica]URA11285.1 TIGR03545 family protein [Thermospira aquatica]